MRGNTGQDIDAQVDALVKKILAANSDTAPSIAQAAPVQNRHARAKPRRHQPVRRSAGNPAARTR